jgi:hypothetical protein
MTEGDQRALVAIGALLIVTVAPFGPINKLTKHKHPPESQTERYERTAAYS